MESLHISLVFFTIILMSSSLHASLTSFSIFGPCQKRCISQFGRVIERLTNTETIFKEFDVSNNTEFNLCKLGCDSPGYADLDLPAFRFGQLAYHNILMGIESEPSPKVIVTNARILCLDIFSDLNKNSSSTLNKVSAKVVLDYTDGVNYMDYVYLLEVLGRGSDKKSIHVVYQNWCYSSTCGITFNAPTTSTGMEVRLRITAFDDSRDIGGIVVSPWYNIYQPFSKPVMNMTLMSVEWKNDRAAARFDFNQTLPERLPMCTLQMMYKNSLNSEYKYIDFTLDRTLEFIVKDLDFNQVYTTHLLPANSSIYSLTNLATSQFEVSMCSHLVSSMSMCAPPPISSLVYNWEFTSPGNKALLFKWAYNSEIIFDILKNTTEPIVPISHFTFTARPLITTNNNMCEKYEIIRRTVNHALREIMFDVPDSDCNYEFEVETVDTKLRISEVKKIQIFRYNSIPTVLFLQASDMTVSMEILALLGSTILIFIVIVVFFLCKKRKFGKETKLNNFVAEEGILYDYVVMTDPTKNVVRIRHPNIQFEPVENIDRNIEREIAQRTYCYNLRNGKTNERGMYPYYNRQRDNKKSPKGLMKYLPRNISGSISTAGDHYYENIRNSFTGSELSDEVFEEDICMSSLCLAPFFNESSSITPMPSIAPYELFNTIPAYHYRSLQIDNLNNKAEEQKHCWKTTVVDIGRENRYTLKVSKNYSQETMNAMREELVLLKKLTTHPHCVSFKGVVIGKWAQVPIQIVGFLMENCCGGTLRSYISSVRSALKDRSDDVGSDPECRDVAKDSSGCISIRFYQFAWQISSALEHLNRTGIVHAGVTSSSIFLFHKYVDPLDININQLVKLGNFEGATQEYNKIGMEENKQSTDVASSQQNKEKCNIWQFGECLVEICSLGNVSKSDEQNFQSGYEQYDDSMCTNVLRTVAKSCLDPQSRPLPSDLLKMFKEVEAPSSN